MCVPKLLEVMDGITGYIKKVLKDSSVSGRCRAANQITLFVDNKRDNEIYICCPKKGDFEGRRKPLVAPHIPHCITYTCTRYNIDLHNLSPTRHLFCVSLSLDLFQFLREYSSYTYIPHTSFFHYISLYRRNPDSRVLLIGHPVHIIAERERETESPI